MAKGPAPAVLIALGAGAYVLLTEDGKRLLRSLTGGGPPPAAPAPRAAAPIASDPYTALIQTAGGLVQSLMPDLADRDSDIRQNLRQLDKNRQKILHKIGLRGDPEKKEKKRKQAEAAQRYFLAGMELFASKVHQAANRSDVHEWVIDTPESGLVVDANTGLKQRRARITIYYKRKDGSLYPYVLWVPKEYTAHQLAWIAEPIVRATGSWTQRGGRLADGAPFVYYVNEEDESRVHAFSDTNPFAVRAGLPTATALEAARKTPEAQAQRLSNLRRKLNPSARAALDKQVANNLNPTAQQ